MDWDECAEIDRIVTTNDWLTKFTALRGPTLSSWISKFHQDKAHCELGEFDMCGAYNWVCKAQFATGEVWAVRFPFGGKVLFPDEKMEAEIAAITAIRQNTTIPVPEVKAWGLSADNELGLGPFMMSTFVDGVHLAQILTETDGKLLREDLSDAIIQTVFRQIANFALQLSRINFDHIGNLHFNQDGKITTGLRRPLTQKAHDILHVGGVDVTADATFPSSKDYFRYIASQDLKHLRMQLNSVDDSDDAARKFTYWSVIEKLVPRFASSEYENGPFKLLCDDFTPLNMLVDNGEDLNIVAVLDWEWSYAGPREFLWSAPHWLLGERPNFWSKSRPELVERYDRNLDIYIRMIEEQEHIVLGSSSLDNTRRPSAMLRKTREDGSMWFYYILRESFNGPTRVPAERLRALVPDFDQLADEVPKDETIAFVEQKLNDLKRYSALSAEKKELHAPLLARYGWTGNK